MFLKACAFLNIDSLWIMKKVLQQHILPSPVTHFFPSVVLYNIPNPSI